MQPMRAIWHDPGVRAALDSGDLGVIVRALRQASHLTLGELADRCGYSVSTLSRMERGKQPLRDVHVLRGLATALGIPPHLLGLADTRPRTAPARPSDSKVTVILPPEEETDPMRRRTLLTGLTSLASTTVLGAGSLRTATADPVSVLETALLDPRHDTGVPAAGPHLGQQVAAARSVFQHGRYAEVATRLPGLLSTALATRTEQAGEQLAVVDRHLADLYVLATELMIKAGNDHLAWITADRACHAAVDSGDVLTHAAAQRTWAIVLRRAGRAELAQRLVVDTAASLQPDLHRGPEYLSVYGSLLSTSAYTAASAGDRDTTRTLLDEAVAAAGRLGADRNDRFTAFGPTDVRLYQVNIARVLGDAGTAIEHARTINPATIPFAERRARFWANLARALYQWDKPEHCYRALLAAEHASPDEIRFRKPIRQITTSLLRHPTTQTLPGLRSFADRAGAAA